MNIVKLFLLTLILSYPIFAQADWFTADFSNESASEHWTPVTGDWKFENGKVSINPKAYDQLLKSDYYVHPNAPYTIEVMLKGERAGIFFGLSEENSKYYSHMIRFDGTSILVGYFTPSKDFTATSVFTVDEKPSDWTKLEVHIDAEYNRFRITVNDEVIGVEKELIFPSGYVGLEASEGLNEFQYLKVLGFVNENNPLYPQMDRPYIPYRVEYLKTTGDYITVYDKENEKLVNIDRRGLVKEIEIASFVPQIIDNAYVNGIKYIIDGNKIRRFDNDANELEPFTAKMSIPVCLIADNDALYVSDPGMAKIFKFDYDGNVTAEFSGSSIGGLIAPHSIDFYNNNTIAIADLDKIVFVNKDFREIEPVIKSEKDEYVIEWENTDDIHPFVQFSSDGKVWKRFEAETSSDGKTNKAVIDQLEPLTRYSYKLTPTLKVIPGQKAKPTEFRLVTPANDQNLLIYNRLPLLFMVYRTISYRDRYPEDQFPQVPWGRTLSDDELEYLRTKATQFNTDFYFRNSSCRVVFDWDFYIIEDTLWLSDVGNEDPYWLSPNQRVTKDFERISEELGKEPTDYAGVICSYAWLNYPDRKTSALRDPSASDGINIRQAYGGAAVGVPAPWKYGETSGYNGNPNPGPHSRQDWLITHEFHHQIDALFNWSGFPEYYHADMPWVMPRRFGEDFDFNAWIIRNQNPEDWLALKFGNLEKTVDADNDGLPDDDPTLPFDEKRLGGDPAKVDTDGDGLTDLEEFMAGNSLSTKLDDPDSDKDGINDKDDPEPLYAIDPEIQKSVNDENLIWNDFGDISGEDYESQLSLAWTESNLYFKSESTKPVNIMLNIDAEGDGWFHGLDNIQIRISNDGTKSEVVEYYLRDCSSWTAPPKDIRDVLSTDNLKYDIEDNDGNIETIIAIPNLPEYGFDLSSGKEFGIRIGLQTSTDRWVWDELFERNYMMLMKLK